MKRILCLWFPRWPLERLAAVRAELKSKAVVLYQRHASGSTRVVAYAPPCLPSAHHVRGIRPGMSLAEAAAMMARQDGPSPPLLFEPHDPLADRLALVDLARWCERFSPTVGLEEREPAESLLLDTTGLETFLGGEAALAARLERALARRGFTVRAAIADTLGAAWAWSHFSPRHAPRVLPRGGSWSALARLPIEALRLPAESYPLLGSLGIKRVEQLAALPRSTLLARFGPEVLRRIDQASGAAAEPIVAIRGVEALEFEWAFEQPTPQREAIEFALQQLIAQLCQALEQRRRGVLRLECRFGFERAKSRSLVVGCYRPSATPRHLEDLLRLKLERLTLPEPPLSIRLAVLAADRLELRQQEFFARQQSQSQPRELTALVDRLSNRLGSHAVVRPWLLAGAQPEFVGQEQPWATLPRRERKPRSAARVAPAEPLAVLVPGDRPLHLEPEPIELSAMAVAPDGPPVQFYLDDRLQRIARYWGPERIETGWWRSRAARRDYYQVETTSGSRFWIYRHLSSGRWFLHGEFL